MANQTIDQLTSKASPTTSDEVPIWDVAGSATKKSTLGQVQTALFSSPTFTGTTTAPEFSASGLTGATAASRYVGATASGAPASGTFAVGDFVIDQSGYLWLCVVAGTPGTWVPAGGQTQGLTSIFTNATAVLSSTNLAFGIISGVMYEIRAALWCFNTVGGEGAQFAFANTGTGVSRMLLALADSTCTPTNVLVSGGTLTTVFTAISATLSGISIVATLNCTGSGTLTLQAAENTHSTGSFSLNAGSWLSIRPVVQK